MNQREREREREIPVLVIYLPTLYNNLNFFVVFVLKPRHTAGKYKIDSIRDLQVSGEPGDDGYDSSMADGKPTLPTSKSCMLTYSFANGCVLTLRTSGTEPKIKWYSEMPGSDPAEVLRTLQDIEATAIEGILLRT